MPQRLDLTGQKFGRLTALQPIGPSNAGYRWLFRCDCGNEHEASGSVVRRGRIQSCGCYRDEVIRTPGGRREYVKVSPLERLMAKVDKNGPTPSHRPDLGPCWIWTGAKGERGYGNISARGLRPGLRTMATHRLAYELVVGPIPEGLELDHLCRTPACCRPTHLEPVTGDENKRRALPFRPRAEVCQYGHDLSDAYRDRSGRRTCRPCQRKRYAEYLARRKARASA